MRYDREDELERMRSRRTRKRVSREYDEYDDYDDRDDYEEDWEEDYDADYDDGGEDGLEEVYIDDRSSGRGGRPVRKRPCREDTRSRSTAYEASYGRSSRKTAGRTASSQGRSSGHRSYYGQQDREGRPGDMQGRRSSSRQAGQSGSRYQEGQRKGKRKKSRLKMVRNLLILAVVLCVGFLAWSFFRRQTGIWTVAVFGVDSRDGGTEKALADVQMICTVDRATGEIKLTSVYRDTYLKIDSEGTYHKINEAYFRGGHEQAVAALEENLDLHIDNYATFNWKSVAQAINVLGGIDLEITDAEFAYINAFITETVNSTGIGSVQLEHAGMQHLDGVQAVAYCRLRLMDTDFQRTERQRKVVSLALEKAKAADAGTLTQLVSAILPQLSTDIGIDDLLPMARNISSYHLGETAGFPFSRQTEMIGRMDCVIPTTLESNVKQLHLFLYGDEHYNPSSKVKEISQKISEDSGLYEEGEPAPAGSGGGSSGGNSGTAQSPTEAPAQTVEETTAEETTTEETTEEETTAEETLEETEEETEEEEIGPGVGPGVSRPSQSDDREEERESEENRGPGAAEPGPGSSGPGVSETVPPSTVPEEPHVSPQGPGAAEEEQAGPGV